MYSVIIIYFSIFYKVKSILKSLKRFNLYIINYKLIIRKLNGNYYLDSNSVLEGNMNKKYIREKKNTYDIVKNHRVMAKVSNLDDAIFVRDLLIENNWNLDNFPHIIQNDDDYLVLAVIDDKLHLLAKYRSKPDDETIKKLIKKYRRNPNNSKYGLNIMNYFDTFIIKKQIFGEEIIFGYYDNLKDAEFVRNFLLDNQWNVNKFSEVMFDDETNTYKVISVIDDAVYVLDSFDLKEEINIDKVHEEFLAKISKHKYGLGTYHHLDLLTDRIEELELKFGVKTKDENWSFKNLNNSSSALNEIIFNMTPFQKAIYDVIFSKTTLDEIEHALVRYKTKNFREKIVKNLNELIELKLVVQIGDETYKKTNF